MNIVTKDIERRITGSDWVGCGNDWVGCGNDWVGLLPRLAGAA